MKTTLDETLAFLELHGVDIYNLGNPTPTEEVILEDHKKLLDLINGAKNLHVSVKEDNNFYRIGFADLENKKFDYIRVQKNK